MRVVSVLPSATEIVCALGHGAELVGRSAECDFPPSVRELRVVMRPRTLDTERPSIEIDRRVRAARERDESLYYLDVEALRDLRPDLLLTQDLCGVCSVTSEEVARACDQAGVAPTIVSLVPRTLSQVWESFSEVARALGDPAAGRRLVATTRDSLATADPAGAERPRVAIVEWVDPPILAGLWTPEIIEVAGGTILGPRLGEPGERTTWSGIAERKPDLVVISPCSFSCERTLRELEQPGVAGEVGRLRPSRGIHVADESYFSRPGPRLADGVRLVRALLQGTPPLGPMPVVRWTGGVRTVDA